MDSPPFFTAWAPVTIHGLTSPAGQKLNNSRAVVAQDQSDVAAGRVNVVVLSTSEVCAVKCANLRAADDSTTTTTTTTTDARPAPSPGSLVRLNPDPDSNSSVS